MWQKGTVFPFHLLLLLGFKNLSRSAGKRDQQPHERLGQGHFLCKELWAPASLCPAVPPGNSSFQPLPDHIGFPRKGWERALGRPVYLWVHGFRQLSNRTADCLVSSALVSCLNAAGKWEEKSIQQNTQETCCFHYNSQPAMPRPLSSDNLLL